MKKEEDFCCEFLDADKLKAQEDKIKSGELVCNIENPEECEALVAAWIKFQNDYGKLSARVHALETDNAEFKADVKQLLKDIQEIKLLLAKNKVE